MIKKNHVSFSFFKKYQKFFCLISCFLNFAFFFSQETEPRVPPVANIDYDTVELNTTLDVDAPGVLANDVLFEQDTILTVVSFSLFGQVFLPGETAVSNNASFTINADGSFTVVPTLGFTGTLREITYTISDGFNESSAFLRLTVEPISDLLEIRSLTSCNQGYTNEGEYKIQYSLSFFNRSTARDFHTNNIINNIDLQHDLDNIYGQGCVLRIEDEVSTNLGTRDFIGTPYPTDFTGDVFNPDFLDGTSSKIFIDDLRLYPRQEVVVEFCLIVNPFCGGRPQPTPSGSGVNFDAEFRVTGDKGDDNNTVLLEDFHTPQTTIAAGFFIPIPQPPVNMDGTFDYVNTVVITNEGNATATNVNYNMGLSSFVNNGISFNSIVVNQVSGPPVNVNQNYNGISEPLLLTANNSIPAGGTVVLEITTITDPVSSSQSNVFTQMTVSQTQGNLDGFDEFAEREALSYVLWSDANGDHLDSYYALQSATDIPSSTMQCECSTLSMLLSFEALSSTSISTETIDTQPGGVVELEEIKFTYTIRNISDIVGLDNLQLQNNLNAICNGNIVSQTPFVITNSNASTTPTLNTGFNGDTDSNIFDGTSGLLDVDQFITLETTIVFREDCIGDNNLIFTSQNPLDQIVTSSDSVQVNFSSNLDNDNVSNTNDIDDDNDTIPDLDEYNGVDPLGDNDGDFVPNYRDLDFGTDANSDGIVDFFDFDNDGIPNHFDLDSDNDGIFDIVEAGNSSLDTNRNGQTNNSVGNNGLDNTIETDDSFLASINYTIPNTDSNGNDNFLDIDSDDDGIVDNIEGQLTFNYVSPNNVFTDSGVDTAYLNGIAVVDTENDGIPDYVDINSDDDIRDDTIEGWDTNDDGIAETIFSGIDLDNDGLDDAYDNDSAAIIATNNQVPTDFPNLDNTDNPERDWREIVAILVVINDVTVTEGQQLNFSISTVKKNDNSILIESAFPIIINFSSERGTSTTTEFNEAIAPFDYEINDPVFTIDPLVTQTSFVISSFDDNIYEFDEFFTLNGRIVSNNTINSTTSNIGGILDNDNPPIVTMNNSEELEGTNLVHTIQLSNPASTPVTINVTTSDITATNTLDYTSFSSDLTIQGTQDPNNPNVSVSFSIATLLDNLNEEEREFINVIGNVTSTNITSQDLSKTGTIIDIDPFPILGITNDTKLEGKELFFTITLLNNNNEIIRNYQPIDIQIQTEDETTTSGLDYRSESFVITIPAFETTANTSITTFDDQLNEQREIVLLRGTTLAPNPTDSSTSFGRGFIDDDDYPNLFSPNNDGRSDTFEILGLESFPNFRLRIVDRWGSEVYFYNNNGRVSPEWWDGTYKGKQVPGGVYFYTLDFNDDQTRPRTGFIQLIR